MNEEKENKYSNEGRNRHYYSRVYPGLWLVIIGVIFLLNSFGYLEGQAWGKLWPIFIIIPGLFMLFSYRHH